MTTKPQTPASGPVRPGHAPVTGQPGHKSTPHWAAKTGKGHVAVVKPLRLPGKGRGG